MSTFSEQLAAAKAAARPFRDVRVLLDNGLSDRRAALLEQLRREQLKAADDERLSAPNTGVVKAQAAVDALMGEAENALVTLRFTRLDGDAWAEITARCPMRLDAPIDRHYNYNMHAVCKLAAPICGGRVEGESVIPLVVAKATPDAPAVDEWAVLFAELSGHEFGLIIEAIYDLNEYEPAKRVADLVKGLATRTA